MKKLLVSLVFWGLVLSGSSQFIPQPLNYPGSGYWPYYISISDPEHVWIGTLIEFGLPYSYSVKTTDGGESWIFDSIPVPGAPACGSICEWDTNTCFFLFTDLNEGGGSIWKTTDGGSTWSGLTTTQFTGGFADFYHAFSADTGVAVGDPTEGYFEIQLTNDGGSSWARLPSENIPLPLSGEYGFNNMYSAAGNSIWFATNKGRCYRSADRGQSWEVTQVVTGSDGMFNVCFSSEQKGVFFKQDDVANGIAVTYDGGATWDTVTIPAGYYITGMSSVGGFDGGFVMTAYKNLIDVFFTPDMFTNLITIKSSIMSIGTVAFLDPATGWLAGGESGVNEIYKYTDVLTSTSTARKEKEKLSVFPNPATSYALVKFPASLDSKSIVLRITDMSGQVIDELKVISTGWTTLNASAYPDGIYIIEVLSGNTLISHEKWVVNH